MPDVNAGECNGGQHSRSTSIKIDPRADSQGVMCITENRRVQAPAYDLRVNRIVEPHLRNRKTMALEQSEIAAVGKGYSAGGLDTLVNGPFEFSDGPLIAVACERSGSADRGSGPDAR